MYSLIIPVYRNEPSISELLRVLDDLNGQLSEHLEVLFVVDGSPDRSRELLCEALPHAGFRSSVLLLSRNFGSFAAIRVGLEAGTGPYFAVMAADLQEPPSLVLQFFRTLESEDVDVVIGTRQKRTDPLLSRLAARLFWGVYRWLVQKDMPSGGIDVFGCTRAVRDRLVSLPESNTTLVGLLLWLGFRRASIGYNRLPRTHGKSAWTLAAKVRYLSDSIFAFSDLPITLMTILGACGLIMSVIFGLAVLAVKLSGAINVPGYAATVLLVTFFGGLNSFGLGLIGSYIWRTFENTKSRPHAVVMKRDDFKR
jgi:glycosyltransferase involved in cell wall biosynthesis